MPTPVCQLEQEWPYLESTTIAGALPRWRSQRRELERFDSPRGLLRFLNGSRPGETDGPLLALLALARIDRLAGRFVLQAILPALRDQAGRILAASEAREEVWELLLFFAWEAICGYPLERRSSVAANLVLQVLHDTTRELRPPRHEPPTLDRILADQPAHDRFAGESLLAAAITAGTITEHDAELILRTRIDGVSLRLVAQTRGIGYHALRQRRQRAERHLRESIDPARVSDAAVSDLIPHAEVFSAGAREARRAA